MSKEIELRIVLTDHDKEEFIENFVELVKIDESSEKYIKQVHVIGDQLKGAQFTFEVNNEGAYRALLFINMQCVKSTEFVNSGVSRVAAAINDTRYVFAIRPNSEVEEAKSEGKTKKKSILGAVKKLFR